MKRIIATILTFSTILAKSQDMSYMDLTSALDDLNTFRINLVEKGYLHLSDYNYEDNGEIIELYVPDTTKQQSHYYYISTVSNSFNLKLRTSAMHNKHKLILEINKNCIRKDQQYRDAIGNMCEKWHCDGHIGIKYKFHNNLSSFYFIKFDK